MRLSPIIPSRSHRCLQRYFWAKYDRPCVECRSYCCRNQHGGMGRLQDWHIQWLFLLEWRIRYRTSQTRICDRKWSRSTDRWGWYWGGLLDHPQLLGHGMGQKWLYAAQTGMHYHYPFCLTWMMRCMIGLLYLCMHHVTTHVISNITNSKH